MINLHGIIYAYHSYAALGELVSRRAGASLPFCSRYRLIDFALSSMTNAGIKDVGVIMHKNYQSLLDHVEGGKEWDLSRGTGGLSLLPPYGLYNSDIGEYRGFMEALAATRAYIRHVKQDDIVLFRGDLVTNIDLREVYERHVALGAEITAVCTEKKLGATFDNIYFTPDESGDFTNSMHFHHTDTQNSLYSSEIYIIKKALLGEMIDWSLANGKLHFHRDALTRYLQNNGRIGIYLHKGYTIRFGTVVDFYEANLDMLDPDIRADLFPEERPIYTKGRSSVSTYYSENSQVKNSLVADGCFIEGEVENSILFRGVRIGKGAKIKDSIIFQDTVIGDQAELTCVICDKNVACAPGVVLTGNRRLPVTVPKGQKL